MLQHQLELWEGRVLLAGQQLALFGLRFALLSFCLPVLSHLPSFIFYSMSIECSLPRSQASYGGVQTLMRQDIMEITGA